MRYSQLLIPTVKETPADAQVISHRLMVRSGMIRKVAAGIYNYLPLGWRVLNKISNIIREEMNRAGAQEILMPAIQPGELWQESGRWQQYGPELLRVRDRKNGEFCVGPTHEEVVTALVRDEVRSYRQLPINLYQIQTKFRDEIRPRFGLMRGREFIMKDAYSFDAHEAGASKSYDDMFVAYHRMFARFGLSFRAVEADTGSIGGNRSHEFQVLADTGEDAIVHCPQCGYAANVELATTARPENADALATGMHIDESWPAAEKVATPHKKSIDDVAKFLKVAPSKVIKAVLFIADSKPIMALCKGDQEVNEIKLKKALGADLIRLMTDEEIVQHTGSPVGFAGPVGTPANVVLLADWQLVGASSMVAGANEKDMHLTHVSLDRDVRAHRSGETQVRFADLCTARAGDGCGRCGSALQAARGIEVGHVFFLGTKYSDAMKAVFLADDGSNKSFVMGCYGIGVGRSAAAALEQNHDDDGAIWPMPIAPFQVAVLALGPEPDVAAAAKQLHDDLERAGIEVLLDDRDERPGVKFKDHDLLGIPVRLAVGAKGLKDGMVELKTRKGGRAPADKVALQDAAAQAQALVRAMLDEAASAADKAAEYARSEVARYQARV